MWADSVCLCGPQTSGSLTRETVAAAWGQLCSEGRRPAHQAPENQVPAVTAVVPLPLKTKTGDVRALEL